MTDETKTPAAGSQSHGHRGVIFFLLVVGVLTLVGLLAAGIIPRLSNDKTLAQSTKEAKTNVPAVVVVKPKWVPDSGLSLPGNIEAIKETTINARTTGYLRRLYVDIGSHVKAGQVVAELQAPDLDQQLYQASAQTGQSRAVVSESQADVHRQKAGVLEDVALADRQRATVEQAQAQLSSSVAAVKQAEAVEQEAEAQLTHAQHTLSMQQAALKQQNAQLELAKVTYERYQVLVRQGFDSQQDLDQALATYKTDQEAVASAEASVHVAEADIVSAQNSVQAAKEAISAAQATVQANQKNVQANIAALKSTEATVNFQQESVRVSQATVAANQAAVSSNVANERRYAVMRGFESVVAPFDGVITSRNVDIGALIIGDSGAGAAPSTVSATTSNSSTATGGGGMLGLARTDQVRIQISVPQTYVLALQAGSSAQVSIRELPRRKFTGSVTLRAGALDTVSRTQLVEVHLPNPGGILVPGMYATVRITPTHPPVSLQVPGTALIVDSNGTRVGVVSRDKHVHMQPVVIGRDFGTEVEILSGLKGTELLVNNPSDLLQDGDKVQIATPAGGRRGRGGSAGHTAQ